MRQNLLYNLFLAVVMMAICSCDYFQVPTAKDKEPAIVVQPADSSQHGTFNGVIRFMEKSQTIGLGELTKKYITITIKGNNLKRIISESSNSNPTTYTGLIVPETGDSITIFGAGKKGNLYFRMHRDAYLQDVRKNNVDSYSGLLEPFSNIFAPLPESVTDYTHGTSPSADLGSLKNCQLTAIHFNATRICQIIYSNDILVPKSLLAYIEFNQPQVVLTLALEVHYSAIEKKSTGKLDKLLNKIDKTLNEITPNELKMESANFTSPSTKEFELGSDFVRTGSWEEMQNILNPPPPPSENGGRHHHHWD